MLYSKNAKIYKEMFFSEDLLPKSYNQFKLKN